MRSLASREKGKSVTLFRIALVAGAMSGPLQSCHLQLFTDTLGAHLLPLHYTINFSVIHWCLHLFKLFRSIRLKMHKKVDMVRFLSMPPFPLPYQFSGVIQYVVL